MSIFGKLPFSDIRRADEQSPQSDSRAEIPQFKNIPWAVYKLCTSYSSLRACGVAGGLSVSICSWLVITQRAAFVTHCLLCDKDLLEPKNLKEVLGRLGLWYFVMETKGFLTFLGGWGKESGQE